MLKIIKAAEDPRFFVVDSSRSLFLYIACPICENSGLISRLPGSNTCQECIFLKPGMFSRYFGSCE